MRRPRLPRLFRSFRRLITWIAHPPRGRSRTTWAAPVATRAARPSTPTLPPEIWEDILHCLRDDRPALAACALTCHNFLPVVRRLVFHTIRLAHGPGQSEYVRFVELLQHSPHVALSVRELTVTIDPDVDHPELPPILPRLHEIERLALNFGGAMFEMSEDTREKLSTYFRVVKRLRLENVRFDGTDLLHILCACSELSELHLSSVRWRRSSLLPAYTADLAAVVPLRPVELEELVLRSPPPQVIAWLVKGPFSLPLRRLQLQWDGSSDGKYASELFRAAGSSLQDLTLAFPGWYAFKDTMDLSRNSRLAGLCLDKIRIDGSQPRYVYIPDPVQLHTYEWIPAALARVRSTRLEQVHFSVELCKAGDLAVLDWEHIDAGLARLAREVGQLVTSFHVHNVDHAPARYDVVDAIMYRLPRLRAQMGRLGVVYTHWSKVQECWYP